MNGRRDAQFGLANLFGLVAASAVLLALARWSGGAAWFTSGPLAALVFAQPFAGQHENRASKVGAIVCAVDLCVVGAVRIIWRSVEPTEGAFLALFSMPFVAGIGLFVGGLIGLVLDDFKFRKESRASRIKRHKFDDNN